MQRMVQNLCTAEWTAEVPASVGGYMAQYSSAVTSQEHFIWRTAFAGVPQNKEVMYPLDTEQIFE